MKKIVVCNQKMFLSHDEAEELRKNFDDIETDEINFIVCPNMLNMDIFKGFNLGAQECYYEDHGAYTGEVSPYHLSLYGIKYVIVGHSERRHVETDDINNLKIKAILKNSMTPIFCIGETKIEKEMRRTCEVLRKQLIYGLKDITLEENQKIYIAYEPSWSIGTEKLPTLEEVLDTILYIKRVITELKISSFKILYGGSVNSNNIKSMCSKEIDGYLLGTCSIDAQAIDNIIKCIK